MHVVTCRKCGIQFDTDREQGVKLSEKRYAHLKCCEEGEGELVPLPEDYDKDLIALEDYINKLFDYSFTPVRVRRTIKKFVEEEGYTYTGILKALRWWFEIQGNPIEPAKGNIQIVPYVYDQAKDHYYGIYLSEYLNENKDLIHNKIKEITICSPEIKSNSKLINVEEDIKDE